MKIIKGKRVGRTWGGDIIQGNDGKRYWKGDKNNYVEEPLEVKIRKKNEQVGTVGNAYPEHYLDYEMPAVNLFEILLGLAAANVLLVGILCIAIVFGIFYTMVSVWPNFIALLVSAFSQGKISVPLIVFTAAVIFLIYYLIHCIRKVISTGLTMSTRYAIICIACIAVPFILLDILSIGFSIFAILNRLIYAVGFALLPTFILWYVEFKANGENLIISIAQTFCQGKTSRRIISIFLGIAALVMSTIIMLFLFPYVGILKGIGWIVSCLLTGIFFILIGVFGK